MNETVYQSVPFFHISVVSYRTQLTNFICFTD